MREGRREGGKGRATGSIHVHNCVCTASYPRACSLILILSAVSVVRTNAYNY